MISFSTIFQVDGDIIQGYTMLYPQMEFYPLVFKPYIDDYSSDPFVPQDPWELIESGGFQHVPLIIGNNQVTVSLSPIPKTTTNFAKQNIFLSNFKF